MAEANQIIFIEAFLASKKIKLTLFLQALFKALKTTITFWCFVFVTLFNLQGTRCVPQRFLMISLRFPFVKNFFQKFFNFFSSSLIRKVLKFYHRRPRRRLNQDTTLSSPCQELFQVFQTFFKFFRPLTWQEKTVSLD